MGGIKVTMRFLLALVLLLGLARAFPSAKCNACDPDSHIIKEDCISSKHPGCAWSSDAYKHCHNIGCQKSSSPTPPAPPTPPTPTPPAPTSDPGYDHQTESYTTSHSPLSSSSKVSVTPFFSPDYSTSTIVDFIDAAESTLEIGTPGFSSWDNCTHFSGCVGCSAEGMSKESFPVFQAILNAAHRGVAVRVITNNYGTSDCDGLISPLPFLSLNGIEVKYFSTVTFYHAKYMSRDKKAASVSSINFSKTSYTKNREAGVLLEGNSQALSFMTSVYETDWARATKLVVNQTYSSADLSIIQSKAKRKYTMPTIEPKMDLTPKPIAVTDTTSLKVYTSPDSA